MINGSGEAGIIFSAAELYRYMYDNNRELMRRVPGKYIARYMGISCEWLSKIKRKTNMN